MMKKLLYSIWLLLLFALQANAQTINLVSEQTVTHSGTGAPANVNVDVGTGKNRVAVVYYFIERDHRPVPSYNDNFPGATGNSPGAFVQPTLGGTGMVARTQNSTRFDTTTSSGLSYFSAHMQIFYQSIPNSTTGNIVFTPGIVNSAKSDADDLIIKIAVYENVSSKSITDNLGPAFGTSYKPTADAQFSSSDTDKFVATMSAATPTNGRTASDILYYGIGGSNKEETLTIAAASSPWQEVSSTILTNSAGSNFPSATYTNSQYVDNEPDGMTLKTVSLTGVATPPHLVFNRTQDLVLFGRAHVMTLLPLAKPSYSGTVYLDTNGLPNIDGTPSNAGAEYVNAVDPQGNLVYSATVSSGGVFTIPQGHLTEGIAYDLVLTTSPTATTPDLNPGYTTVGESISGAGLNDGTPDGIFSVTPGLNNVTGIRFGFNICSAGDTAPAITNANPGFACPATGVNLTTASGVSSAPSGSSLVWFDNNTHTGTALTGTAITNAGIGTYYAFFYDDIAGCYSPVSVAVVVESICANDDDFTDIDGTSGGTIGNVLADNGNGTDQYNGNPATTATVTITVTDPADPIGGNPNVPVVNTATGDVTVPAGTPAGTYTIEYEICANPDGTPCDGASVTITVFNTTIDVAVNKVGPLSAEEGSTINYQIHVTNNGSGTANNVTVMDPPVSNFTVTGIAYAVGAGTGGSAVVTPANVTVPNLQGAGINIDELPADAAVTFTITGTVGDADDVITNTATVIHIDDTDGTNNESTVITEIFECVGAETTYTFDADATLALPANATPGINGGTIQLVYVLQSGTAISGVGNITIGDDTRFTIPVTYTDLNNHNAAVDNQWKGDYVKVAGASSVNAFMNDNLTVRFNVLPSNPPPVVDIPNSIYQTPLPALNTVAQPLPAAASSGDQWFTDAIAAGTLKTIGHYNISIGNYPAAPAGYVVKSEQFRTVTAANKQANVNSTSGFWSKPLINAEVVPHSTGGVNFTSPVTMQTGQEYVYRYSAYNTYSSTGSSSYAGLTAITGLQFMNDNSITFAKKCVPMVITNPMLPSKAKQ